MQTRQAAIEATEALRNGVSLNQIITMLRQRGLTKMESMIVLEDDLGMHHRDAKLAVHRSDAWKDQRDAAEDLEERLLGSEEG